MYNISVFIKSKFNKYNLRNLYNLCDYSQTIYFHFEFFLLKVIKIFHCAILNFFEVVCYVKYFSLFYTTRPCAIKRNLEEISEPFYIPLREEMKPHI